MKRTLYGLTLFAVALAAILAMSTAPAVAQVPPGVVVDSIAPASDWTNIFPPRPHHFVADPKTGRLAFVTGTTGSGGSPVFLSSTDDGATWSSLTGFTYGGGARVAAAADSSYTIHIAYRVSLASGAIALVYDKDANGDGTGLGNPVMINDTNLIRTPNYPDIAVSPDGQNIIVMAMHWNAMDSLWAFVSHDGGTSWKSIPVISQYDPSAKPANDNPALHWYTHTLAMGKNGYAIMFDGAQYDSMGTAGRYWELYSETRDYGETWSKPTWVTPVPATTEYLTGETWGEQAQIIVTNDSIPHFATALLKPGGTWESRGPREMVEFHKQGATWVHHTISHFDELTGSFNLANNGSLTVDTTGKLYCVFSNRNNSALPTFSNGQFSNQLYIAGSTDGGNTWTEPVRLTDKERMAAGEEGDVKCIGNTQVSPVISDKAVAIWIDGVYPGYYSGGPQISAWAQARFPLSIVWTGPFDKDTKAPKANGYAMTAKGAGAYKWYEVSGTGTKVSGWRNGAVAFGDTARDDGSAGPFPLGINFWFYGKNYSTFSVGANGLLGLSDSILNSAVNQPDPANTKGFYDGGYNFPGIGNPFHAVIAAYYNDLDLTPHDLYGTGHGDVFYWHNAAADTAVIEWYQAGDFNAADDTTLTFEVILAKKDSSVAVMFKNIGYTGTELTAKVGVQAVDSIGVAFWNAGYPAGNTPAANAGVIFKHTGPTAIAQGPQVPLSFTLMQNYPNPFNPATKIAYSLPRQLKATLKVFNVLGQEVATLVNEVQTAGQHTVNFNANGLASGVYIYRLQAGEFTSSYKMLLMK
jgi:hypothetical protein